ncbi:MAG: cupredoxin domain-containing protein [Bacteroidota bacterium]
MGIDQIVVTIGGLLLAGWIGWFFWFSERKATKVESSKSGIQEAFIKVKGGYSPDIIMAEVGKPLRLHFLREETALCSEQVIFPDLKKQTTLTPFKTVTLDLMPEKTGEYVFQCGMGMLHGKLIIREKS